MRIGQSWISPCIQFNCVSPYGRINGTNPDGSYGIPAMNFDETFARAQDYSGLVETSLEGPSFDVSGVVCSPGHWGTAVVVPCITEGLVYSIDGCTECGFGFFSTASAASSCTQCPIGTYLGLNTITGVHDLTTSNSSLDCLECVFTTVDEDSDPSTPCTPTCNTTHPCCGHGSHDGFACNCEVGREGETCADIFDYPRVPIYGNFDGPTGHTLTIQLGGHPLSLAQALPARFSQRHFLATIIALAGTPADSFTIIDVSYYNSTQQNVRVHVGMVDSAASTVPSGYVSGDPAGLPGNVRVPASLDVATAAYGRITRELEQYASSGAPLPGTPPGMGGQILGGLVIEGWSVRAAPVPNGTQCNNF